MEELIYIAIRAFLETYGPWPWILILVAVLTFQLLVSLVVFVLRTIAGETLAFFWTRYALEPFTRAVEACLMGGPGPSESMMPPMEETPHNGDQAGTYTPAEAGRVLGVTDERIRQLLDAGDLDGSKVAGRWHVVADSVHRLLRERGEPRGPSRRRGRSSGGTEGPNRDELVEELRARIEDLRADRDAWREQARRSDYLLGSAMERTRELEDRLRALEPPSEATEAPMSPGPTHTPTEAPATAQTPSSRPWWRRLISGG